MVMIGYLPTTPHCKPFTTRGHTSYPASIRKTCLKGTRWPHFLLPFIPSSSIPSRAIVCKSFNPFALVTAHFIAQLLTCVHSLVFPTPAFERRIPPLANTFRGNVVVIKINLAVSMPVSFLMPVQMIFAVRDQQNLGAWRSSPNGLNDSTTMGRGLTPLVSGMDLRKTSFQESGLIYGPFRNWKFRRKPNLAMLKELHENRHTTQR